MTEILTSRRELHELALEVYIAYSHYRNINIHGQYIIDTHFERTLLDLLDALDVDITEEETNED